MHLWSPIGPEWLSTGRLDWANPAGPILIWQSTVLSTWARGRTLELQWNNLFGESHFDIRVEGVPIVWSLRAAGLSTLRLDLPSDHEVLVQVTKRSEAAAGWAQLVGTRGAALRTPTEPEPSLRILLIGDSITVGACNEDGAEDQWEDRITHNNLRSYSALVASALGAEHRNIAVSGMGVVMGYVEPTAEEIWDRLYPVRGSVAALDGSWQPDVVAVNLGENDDSFSKNQGLAFPGVEFIVRYVRLIEAIRARYPRAPMVLLRGGMAGGALSEPLVEAWEEAVRRLSGADAGVFSFRFRHWSSLHPRVADDEKMAQEWLAWWRDQEWLPQARRTR
jgi:lysophospholipase L1-like esterase